MTADALFSAEATENRPPVDALFSAEATQNRPTALDPAGVAAAASATAAAATVRRITVADTARVRALRLEMLADTPLAFLETLAQAAARPHAEYRRRAAQFAAGDERAQFIAERDGRVVGQVGGLFLPAVDVATTVVFAVYVTPTCRGSGVLELLIDAVAAWSRAAGRPRLLLEVVTGNARALRAYQRIGFTDTGKRQPHPTISGLTELVMTRPA
jgi:GNAT superfamily N-acetyltransferase